MRVRPWVTVAFLMIGLTPLGAASQVAVADTQSSADSGVGGPTVTVVAGARYAAGWLHRLLLGAHYRDLWTTPVQAERLDLDTFAGGLTATRQGGGQQTKSLRFRGANGREYAFRSVDKDPSAILPLELRGTVVASVVQDQISAGHPAAPFVVAPLLEAAGVLSTRPRLVVLPTANPRLGEFQASFGGMLGILEERPEANTKGEPGFAGALEIISSDQLLKRLEHGPDNRVEARAFLAARLMDVFLGDWDRHRDQWRWARLNGDSPARWVPVPRDRDQAFARYDGLLLTVARGTAPQLVRFGPSYPGMLGLTWNGRDLDRYLLVGLERPVWDSVAADLQAKLTDQVIEHAVAQLPASYRPADSARLSVALKQRRDHLPEAARRFYRHLAGQVDVHATDVDELILAQRPPEGGTRIEIHRASDGPGAEPFFSRRFDPTETSEVRIFLHGGDDRVVVRGEHAGPRLRIVGGGGSDEVADSSRGGALTFYAAGDGDRALPGRSVAVDRKPYHPKRPAVRDWGTHWLSLVWLSAGPDIGLLAGAGVTHTRYGFRKDPYAARYRLRGGYSTGASTVNADLTAEWRRTNSPVRFNLLARASGIDVVRFHGFGNETSAAGSSSFYRVDQIDYQLRPGVTLPVADHLDVTAGPVLRYTKTDFDRGRFIDISRPYGSGEFGMFGGGADLRLDTRDRSNAATRGVLVTLGGSYYAAVFDVERQFGELHGEASTYVTAPHAPLQPTLAFRAGGKRVWGTFPYQEAAFIGGNSTVRLGRQNRYAGDAALYGGAELRLFLTRFSLVLPGDFGVFGLADVGRVFLEGESSDVWHAAAGGGIWFAFLDRANTMSVALARGAERTGLYVKAGFGF